MKKLPYFPFYYLDWLSSSSVSMMTHEEKGLFIDMLSRCYNDDGLPDDNNKLQRLFNCSEELLESVKTMFYSVDGLLKNEKIESIIKDQQKMVKGKSKAGKASAKARAAKKLHQSTGVEHVLNSVATESQRNSTNRTEQNRTKQNKTLEERKEEFKELTKAAWLKLGGANYLAEGEVKKFFGYWSEHGENDKKMRFEKQSSFGIGRRLGTWKSNSQKNSEGYANA